MAKFHSTRRLNRRLAGNQFTKPAKDNLNSDIDDTKEMNRQACASNSPISSEGSKKSVSLGKAFNNPIEKKPRVNNNWFKVCRYGVNGHHIFFHEMC